MSDKSLAIIPRSLDEMRTLSKTLSESALIPAELRNKAADVFVSILAGQELGLPPMAALRGVHVVKGKPVLSADTMVGIVLGSGLAEYFSCVEETAHLVTYETKRRGSPHSQTCTWTMADAQTAGLGGDNWKKYPRAMLKARCKAMLARDVYPDVLAGCYDTDEAREIAGPALVESFTPAVPMVCSPAIDVPDAELVSETPALSLLDTIDAAPSEDALKSLMHLLSKLPDAEKAEARRRYGARRDELRKASAA